MTVKVLESTELDAESSDGVVSVVLLRLVTNIRVGTALYIDLESPDHSRNHETLYAVSVVSLIMIWCLKIQKVQISQLLVFVLRVSFHILSISRLSSSDNTWLHDVLAPDKST